MRLAFAQDRKAVVSSTYVALLCRPLSPCQSKAGQHQPLGLLTKSLFGGLQGRATDTTTYKRPITQPERPFDAPSSTFSFPIKYQVAPILSTHMFSFLSRLGACPQPRCSAATC